MQIKLQQQVYDKLKAMSKQLGMPMASCVNMMVTEWHKLNPKT